MASKCTQGKIRINKGKYFEDVFKNVFVDNYTRKRNFIGLIPFARNLFQYLSNNDSYTYLTSCLHMKVNTSDVTVEDVHNQLIKVIPSKSNVELEFKEEKIIDLIFKESDLIILNFEEHSVDLENKLVLSMACRLKAEIYMISQVGNAALSEIDDFQTQKLYQLCVEKQLDNNTLILLNRVNLITPEHIHVNSFMFEPLVDMSMNYLVDLYKDISALHSGVEQAA